MDMERGNPKSRHRLETRIMHYQQFPGTQEYGDQYWRGYTYVWNDEQTDAELLDVAVGEVAEFGKDLMDFHQEEGEAVDGDARDALERFGHRTIGQRANILRGDRIDDGVGVLLDVLSIGERGAQAADDDFADRLFHRGRIFDLRFGLGLILRPDAAAADRAADNQRRSTGAQSAFEPRVPDACPNAMAMHCCAHKIPPHVSAIIYC